MEEDERPKPTISKANLEEVFWGCTDPRSPWASQPGFDKTKVLIRACGDYLTINGWAPYTRKRHRSTENLTTQVTPPNKLHITTQTLPAWNPPQPTPPPETHATQPPPMDTLSSPLLPTTTQSSSQPQISQPIRPLMEITFTPHTILRFKTCLQQLHPLTHHSNPHNFTHPRHTPNHTNPHHLYTPMSCLPYPPPFLALLHTLTQLVHTVQHIATMFQGHYPFQYA